MSTVDTRVEEGGVLIAAMRRGKANAMAPDLVADLHAALDQAEDETVGALVLTSDLERFFSAGLDVPLLLELDRSEMAEFMSELGRAFRRVFALGKPVVAALPGHAMAGGLILALAADWRILAEGKAKLGVNEVDLGIPIPDAAMVMVTHRVGMAVASRLALRCETLDAQAALAAGVVDRLCPPERVLQEAIELARDRGAQPPAGFARTKAAMIAPALAHMQDDSDDFVDVWLDDPAQTKLHALVASLKK